MLPKSINGGDRNRGEPGASAYAYTAADSTKAPAAVGWPHNRPGVSHGSSADAGCSECRSMCAHRPGPVVLPPRRRAIQRSHRRVDAPPVATLRAHARCRGRHQYTDPPRSISPRLGAVSGTLRSAGPRGRGAPCRRARPSASPSLTNVSEQEREHADRHRSQAPGHHRPGYRRSLARQQSGADRKRRADHHSSAAQERISKPSAIWKHDLPRTCLNSTSSTC